MMCQFVQTPWCTGLSNRTFQWWEHPVSVLVINAWHVASETGNWLLHEIEFKQIPGTGGYHRRQCRSRLTGTTKPTNLPASIVAFSFFPSSEPEATMALSMSPVARWQTQKFLANLGACGGENKNQNPVTTAGPRVRLPGSWTWPWNLLAVWILANANFLTCNRDKSTYSIV